eukprot:520922-Heterocapsa_arctica.AAC.1
MWSRAAGSPPHRRSGTTSRACLGPWSKTGSRIWGLHQVRPKAAPVGPSAGAALQNWQAGY